MESSVAAATDPQSANGRYPLSVVLGEHTYEVFPQRHAYLNHKLGKWFESLSDVSEGAENVEGLHDFLGLIGERAYDLLKVMIPDIMAEHEFRGFPTKEAMEAGDYQEEYDKSPSYPEVFAAFQTCLTVNKLDQLRQLGKAIDPRIIRAYLTQAVAGFLSQRNSASSSADDTDGPPIISGTPDLASVPNAD